MRLTSVTAYNSSGVAYKECTFWANDQCEALEIFQRENPETSGDIHVAEYVDRDRLTKWNGSKWILPQGKTSDGESYWRIIADRLAAYENTGLSPEEIEEMKGEKA